MRSHTSFLCNGIYLALLRLASMLVPLARRDDWLNEWRAELWYAQRAWDQSHAPAWTTQRKLMDFCLGAWQDARCLRNQRRGIPLATARGSALECMVLLLVLLAVAVGTAAFAPRIRLRMKPAHAHSAQDLMFIQNAQAAEKGDHTLPAAQYKTWKEQRQHIFQSFAFYQMISRGPVHLGSSRRAALRVARASESIFDVLGSPIQTGSGNLHATTGEAAAVVLSRELWETEFKGDLKILGHQFQLGAQTAIITAIAPASASQLPGRPDAWLLVPDDQLPPTAKGFIMGRLKPSFNEAMWGERWQMSALTPDGSSSDFTCVSLAENLRQPWDLFVFSVLLALLALPATTSLPLGEYRSGPHRVSVSTRLRRWSFFVSKMGLVLIIVYFSSMDLAYVRSMSGPNGSQYIQLISCFIFCLWGFRWALRDQRQRCPVCLGKLTHPARVGHPSRNFLAWNGTELMCTGGHGLLHVPEVPTSWFSTQRWLYLDSSWEVLFPDPSLVSTAVM